MISTNSFRGETVNNTTINDCRLIELEKFSSNRRGNLTPVSNNKEIPFKIRRVYYLHDIPAGAERGAHAHKLLQQLIISVSGSFDVVLNDGKDSKTFNMNVPYNGLLLPGYIWRELKNFSAGSICLVLASQRFEVEDYIRDYDEFLKIKAVSKFHE